MRQADWSISNTRVERVWRREGLKVPAEQQKRRRLWLTDGLYIRLRLTYSNHVWSYDFVEDRAHDSRSINPLARAKGLPLVLSNVRSKSARRRATSRQKSARTSTPCRIGRRT